MAMGRLSNRLKAAGTGSRLAVDLAPRHAFYDWCNEVLAEAEFDEAVEMLCQPHYQDGVGRPSIPPAGQYIIGTQEYGRFNLIKRMSFGLHKRAFLKALDGIRQRATLSLS